MASTLLSRAVDGMTDMQSQTNHDAFPSSITDGLLRSPNGVSAQSLNELQEFIYELFVFRMPKNFFIQMAVAGSCICFLIIAGGATVLSRIFQRTFWVFKATRRSEGSYLVPNALNTFLLFEGVFAFVWLAFIIVQYYAYWIREDAMQHHIATLNLIIWWPLWIGAFMAAWGSFYTAPGALDKGPLSSSTLNRFLPKPFLINIFCVGTPFILIISLIPLIVLAQRQLNSAFSAYHDLANDIQAAIRSSANPATAATQAQAAVFLSRASDVWDMQVKTAYYEGIGYTIWPVWAGIFLLFYIPAGGYLTFLVWKQVCKQKTTLVELRQKYIEDDALAARAAAEQAANQRAKERKYTISAVTGSPVTMRQVITLGAGGTGGEDSTNPSQLPDPSQSLLFQPLTSSQLAASTAVPEQGLSPPVTPSTVVNSLHRKKHANSSSTENSSPPLAGRRLSVGCSDGAAGEEDVFFPALRPEVRQRAAAAARRLSSVGGTPYSRYKYLRRCFINLTILYVAVCFGAALYLGVSAALGRSLHRSYQRGPQAITNIVYGCCVATAWGAVACGSCAVFAIMARLIDPANAAVPTSREDSAEKKSSTGGRAVQRIKQTLKCGTSASYGGGSHPLASPAQHGSGEGYGVQEKTRTLPAVPESVGATMDEDMLMGGSMNGVGLVSVPASVSIRSPYDSQTQSTASRYDGARLLPTRYTSRGAQLPKRESSLLLDVRGSGPHSSTSPTKRSPGFKMSMRAQPGDGFVLEPTFDPTVSAMSANGFPESQTTSLNTFAEEPSLLFSHSPAVPAQAVTSSRPTPTTNRSRGSSVSRKRLPAIPLDALPYDEEESMVDTQQPATKPMSPVKPLAPARLASKGSATSSSTQFHDAPDQFDEETDESAAAYRQYERTAERTPRAKQVDVPASPPVPSRFAAQAARAQARQAPSMAPRVTPRRQSLQGDNNPF